MYYLKASSEREDYGGLYIRLQVEDVPLHCGNSLQPGRFLSTPRQDYQDIHQKTVFASRTAFFASFPFTPIRKCKNSLGWSSSRLYKPGRWKLIYTRWRYTDAADILHWNLLPLEYDRQPTAACGHSSAQSMRLGKREPVSMKSGLLTTLSTVFMQERIISAAQSRETIYEVELMFPFQWLLVGIAVALLFTIRVEWSEKTKEEQRYRRADQKKKELDFA